ncbi:MAG: very short patch repair endonuclease [Opitutales bacterium]
MADVFSKSQRSALMARIRGRGNEATELALARLLRSEGITGWRRHTALFGRPDFAFCRARSVIFVDGCFWHGCPRCYCRPRSNRKFWDGKLRRNRARDRLVNRMLRAAGWMVLRIWEHELRDPAGLLPRLRRLAAVPATRPRARPSPRMRR